MIHAKSYSCSPMAVVLPFLLSAVILTTSAFGPETDDDDRTSSVQSPKTEETLIHQCCAGDNLEGNIQARFRRSPLTTGVLEMVSWKGLSVPKLEQTQRSKRKAPLSDLELRWQSTGDGKSLADHQVDPERGNLEEELEERRSNVSNGIWIVKNELNHGGIKPSVKAVDSRAECDRKRVGSRKWGEDRKIINRPLSVAWSRPKFAQSSRDTGSKSRARRYLSALKRMVDDVGVQQTREARSDEATLQQDSSKQPKYGAPRRTWRTNVIRVWG